MGETRVDLVHLLEDLPDESIVWINDAHPAYRRAATSRAEGYHIALTVASALAPLTVDAPRTQEFVNAFLARWGEGAFEGPRRPRGDSG